MFFWFSMLMLTGAIGSLIMAVVSVFCNHLGVSENPKEVLIFMIGILTGLPAMLIILKIWRYL